MPNLICEYCAHHNTGADPRCAHCGAPLSSPRPPSPPPATVAPEPASRSILGDTAKVLSGTAKRAADAEHIVTAAVPAVAGTERAIGAGVRWLAARSWLGSLVGIALLVALGTVIIHSCAGRVPSLGNPDGLDALPARLRSASSCQQSSGAQQEQDCVIQPGNTLLTGDITGGAPLKFSVRIQQPDQIRQSIATWRAAGPTVLADGSVFVAIGSSFAAWYADTRTGLRIETGGFVDRGDTRTFLVRSGLIM